MQILTSISIEKLLILTRFDSERQAKCKSSLLQFIIYMVSPYTSLYGNSPSIIQSRGGFITVTRKRELFKY